MSSWLKVSSMLVSISDSKKFESVFSNFDSYTNSEFRSAVCSILDNGGHVTVSTSVDPERNNWDGVLNIHFSNSPDAKEVVKLLRKANHPDDFNMIDSKTLHLWWD